jgi:hypothetical protein
MNNAVSSDMAWSSVLFLDRVWPLCKGRLGGGELMQMEGRPDTELARMLDMRAGIDGWHLRDEGMRGIASRIQKGNDWRTFTIRMKRDSGATTEYEKRNTAINGGWIYPRITIQAYAQTEKGPILSIGIAYTSDIIGFINKGLHRIRNINNATFAVCEWIKMKTNGYRVDIIDSSQWMANG